MEVSLTGLKGPAGRGRVVGLRGCDLVLPWGTHPRMATAPAGLAPRLEGLSGKIWAHEQIQSSFFSSPQQCSDKLAFSRRLY